MVGKVELGCDDGKPVGIEGTLVGRLVGWELEGTGVGWMFAPRVIVRLTELLSGKKDVTESLNTRKEVLLRKLVAYTPMKTTA